MVSSPEMIAISESNDSQLVVRGARGGIDQCSQIVIPDGRAPVTLLADKLGLPVTGEIAQANKGCMARLEDMFSEAIRRFHRELSRQAYRGSISIN